MSKWTEEKRKRRFLRRTYRQGNSPALHPSLMECDRYRVDEDAYEYYTEYGFLPEKIYGKNVSECFDETIDAWIDDYVRRYVTSPYDCSGQSFTRWITWHRNPCGRISFVHGIGIDV